MAIISREDVEDLTRDYVGFNRDDVTFEALSENINADKNKIDIAMTGCSMSGLSHDVYDVLSKIYVIYGDSCCANLRALYLNPSVDTDLKLDIYESYFCEDDGETENLLKSLVKCGQRLGINETIEFINLINDSHFNSIDKYETFVLKILQECSDHGILDIAMEYGDGVITEMLEKDSFILFAKALDESLGRFFLEHRDEIEQIA